MARSSIPRFPFDPDLKWFAAVPGVIGAVAFVFAWTWLWVLALIILIFLLGFFRDPPRRIPKVPGAVVCPADGKIVSIQTNQDDNAGPLEGPCVIIFLAVYNVHINRCPAAGVIESIRYQPGLKLDARNPKSSRLNECNWIYLRSGPYRMTVRQIAGKIARRVVCRLREGRKVRRGQRLGLIRFGSRTELYLPPEARLQVHVGQSVYGGETVIAYLPEIKSA